MSSRTFITAMGIVILLNLVLLFLGASINVYVNDEIYVLKDPAKVLYSYYKGAIPDVKMYTFYWIVLAFKGIIFVIGKLFGAWDSLNDFIIKIGCGELFPYPARILPILIALLNIFVIIYFTQKISTILQDSEQTKRNLFKVMFTGLLLLNPIYINVQSVFKFDVFAYTIYNILFALAFLYSYSKQEKYLFWLFIALWFGLATRLEFIGFVPAIGIFLLMLYLTNKKDKYKINLKTIVKGNLAGLIIYFATIWLPIVITRLIFYDPAAKPYTKFFTFFTAHLKALHSKLSDFKLLLLDFLNSDFKVIILFTAPLVIFLLIYSLYYLATNKKQNVSLSKADLPILALFLSTLTIYLAVLLIHGYNQFRYLLLPVTTIIWLFLWAFFKILKHSNLSKTTLYNIAKYFGTITLLIYLGYAINLAFIFLPLTQNHITKDIWTYIKKHSSTGDIILSDVYPDCDVTICPSFLKEQIDAIKSIGRTTGRVLTYRYEQALKDSSKCVEVYLLAEFDYFWKGTEYEGKWILTSLTEGLKKQPRFIIFFKNLYGNIDSLRTELHNKVDFASKHGYKLVASYDYVDRYFFVPWIKYHNEWLLPTYFVMMKSEEKQTNNEQ